MENGQGLGSPTNLHVGTPVSLLVKDIKVIKADDGTEEGVFEGYASTFNNADLTGDIILPGAFKGSIRSKGKKGIKLLLDHSSGSRVGRLEEIAEDEKGLFIQGRINLEKVIGRDTLSDLKFGSLDALSIGFRIPNSKRDVEWSEDGETRTIKRVDLWEVSLVTFPANLRARVTNIKANEITTSRQFEKFLRDSGFPKAFSTALTTMGFEKAKEAISGRRDSDGEVTELAAAFWRLAAKITNRRDSSNYGNCRNQRSR